MMEAEMIKIGESLIEMGQKILDAHKSKQGSDDDGEEEEESEAEEGSGMPKKALIIASLKRKIG